MKRRRRIAEVAPCLPATLGTLPGASYAVTGGTAGSADSNTLLKRSWPRVFAFVLTFAFLHAAVLIDATIVRAVLLPATMKLLGDRNGYLPRWLNWLPTLSHAQSADAHPRPALAATN